MHSFAKAILSWAVVLILAFAAGCAEKPTQVGARLLPASDFIQLDTSVVTALSSYNAPAVVATSISPRILVGAVNGIQCYGIYRFSTLPDSVSYMPIVGAELQLRAVYHFGDSLAPLSFTVHKILENWATDSLTIDSLNAPGFYNPVASGFWSGVVGDTETITIPLDTNMIRSWGTASDSIMENFGVLLRPTNNLVVKGFGSFSISGDQYVPKLVLRFLNEAYGVDTLTVSLGVHRFVTTGLDPSWPSDSTHLYVQNGAASEGYINFDVSSIPAHAAIHKAMLQLTLDQQRSRFNYFTADSAIAYFIDDTGVPLTYISGIGEPSQAGSVRTYTFPVGSFVQRWVRGAKTSRIAIAGYAENNALDLFSFYGARQLEGLKPKLTIIYSVVQ